MYWNEQSLLGGKKAALRINVTFWRTMYTMNFDVDMGPLFGMPRFLNCLKVKVRVIPQGRDFLNIRLRQISSKSEIGEFCVSLQ